jgi:peptide-methionine (R)-S-oxide reductase
MIRRDLLRWGLIAALTAVLPGWRRAGRALAGEATPMPFQPLNLSDAEWRKLLTPEQYRVLRDHGTERAGSSPLDREKRAGTFVCAGCYLPLFSSQAKFDSGTGWPSFFQPINAANVGTSRDFWLLYPRTEYHCARCGGHQGHVFDDGPPPTGQRWCNNGVALQFVVEGDALPPLRNGDTKNANHHD